jgi:parallel beta-helix repeat protein
MNAATIYVNQSNKYKGQGSKENPFKKIQNAIFAATAGVTIEIAEGVYSERLYISNSGKKDQWIHLKAKKNNRVILDGSELSFNKATDMIYIEDQHYIKISDIEIRNVKAEKYNSVVSALSINGQSSYIHIENLKIHNIEAKVSNSEEGDAHAIVVRGDKKESCQSITINQCEISKCKFGSSEAIAINGNVKDFIVSNNHIYDVDNIAIDFIGHEKTCSDPKLDYARDGICFGNKILRVSSFNNPSYEEEKSAGGIYVDGGANIIIERNIISDCDIGIEIASEHKGKVAKDIVIRNNVIKNSFQSGILLGGFDKNRGEVERCWIINNTLIDNDLSNWSMGEIGFQYYVSQCVLENNLFIKLKKSNSPLYISSTAKKHAPINLSINHNAYYDKFKNADWKITKVVTKFNQWQKMNHDHDGLLLNDIIKNDEYNYSLDLLKNAGKYSEMVGELDVKGKPRHNLEEVNIGALDF